MFKKNKHQTTDLQVNESVVAESIELRVKRLLNNKEPIQNEATLQYTSAKDGVRPEHDIRTDKWEIAVEQMDKVIQMKHTKRKAEDTDTDKKDVTDITKNTSDEQQQSEN